MSLLVGVGWGRVRAGRRGGAAQGGVGRAGGVGRGAGGAGRGQGGVGRVGGVVTFGCERSNKINGNCSSLLLF